MELGNEWISRLIWPKTNSLDMSEILIWPKTNAQDFHHLSPKPSHFGIHWCCKPCAAACLSIRSFCKGSKKNDIDIIIMISSYRTITEDKVKKYMISALCELSQNKSVAACAYR